MEIGNIKGSEVDLRGVGAGALARVCCEPISRPPSSACAYFGVMTVDAMPFNPTPEQEAIRSLSDD